MAKLTKHGKVYNSEKRKGKKRGSYKKTWEKSLSGHLNEGFKAEAAKDTTEVKSEPINAPVQSGGEPLPEIKPAFKEVSGEDMFLKFKNDYAIDTPQNNEPLTDSQTPQQNEPSNITASPDNTPVSQDQRINQLRTDSKGLVNGYFLITLMDVAMPSVIKFFYKFADDRAKKVKVKDCKLDADQREAIMACADVVADYILNKINPLVLFGLMSGTFYYQNFSGEVENFEKVHKKKKSNEETIEPEDAQLLEEIEQRTEKILKKKKRKK